MLKIKQNDNRIQDRLIDVDYSTERLDETFFGSLSVTIHKIEFDGRDITNLLSSNSIEIIEDKIQNKL